MKKLVIILMLLTFSVAGVGCYGTGECPQGICSEEHSKSTGPPEKVLKSNFIPLIFRKTPLLWLRRGFFVFWRNLWFAFAVPPQIP